MHDGPIAHRRGRSPIAASVPSPDPDGGVDDGIAEVFDDDPYLRTGSGGLRFGGRGQLHPGTDRNGVGRLSSRVGRGSDFGRESPQVWEWGGLPRSR